MAFLVRDNAGAVIIHADAVDRTKAVGDDFGLQAIPADLEHRAVLWHQGRPSMAGAFCVIKIALPVRLQARGEFVEMVGDLVVVVEILDEISFPVAVAVAQSGDLVAAPDIDDLVHNLQPQGLKQSRGNALPRHFFQCPVDSFHQPHIAVPSANGGRVSVLEKIKTAQAHP